MTDGQATATRVRHDGWTAAKRRAFLRALGETGCVRDACAHVRLSSTSAYRHRQRDEGFARAWTRAIARAHVTIEQAAYDRAVEGWDEPVFHAGKQVGVRRRYSDSMLRLLVQRGQIGTPPEEQERPQTPEELERIATEAAQRAGGSFMPGFECEATRERLRIKMELIARRLAGLPDVPDEDESLP